MCKNEISLNYFLNGEKMGALSFSCCHQPKCVLINSLSATIYFAEIQSCFVIAKIPPEEFCSFAANTICICSLNLSQVSCRRASKDAWCIGLELMTVLPGIRSGNVFPTMTCKCSQPTSWKSLNYDNESNNISI